MAEPARAQGILLLGAGKGAGSGGAATAITTFNPADRSANVALSNGNLTVQGTTTADGGVRSTTSKATGKLYFEVAWSSNLGGGDTGCGIATPGAVLSSIGVSAVNAALIFVSGNIYINGANVGTLTPGAPPFTICTAIDLVNSNIWFRSGSGLWNGSGAANPATNVGGFSISALFPTNPAYAVMAVSGNTTPTYTGNFGALAFAQAVPAGFSAWG
jgi:hypothetical protein